MDNGHQGTAGRSCKRQGVTGKRSWALKLDHPERRRLRPRVHQLLTQQEARRREVPRLACHPGPGPFQAPIMYLRHMALSLSPHGSEKAAPATHLTLTQHVQRQEGEVAGGGGLEAHLSLSCSLRCIREKILPRSPCSYTRSPRFRQHLAQD